MPRSSWPWVFFPDYTAGNPYQGRVAEELASLGWTAYPGDIAAALRAQAGGNAVFHLGWEQPIYLAAPDATGAEALATEFFAQLASFRRAGGTFVWTVHNAVPHEERFPRVNLLVQQGIATRADAVHVHNMAGARHAECMGAPPGRIHLHRHPSYGECYPNDVDDAAARRYLGLAPNDTVYAFFGALRGYKGLAGLARAFDLASAAVPQARLVIAGRAPQPSAARYHAPSPQMRVLPRFIPDAEVQYILRAADCVVLPYENVLTSGAMALAQAFARPVIVPNLPSLAEEVADGVNGFLYEAGDEDSLLDALLRAAAELRHMRTGMRDAAHAAFASRDFAGLARCLARAADADRLPRAA